MNAVDLLGRGRAGLGRADLASSFDDFVRPGGPARARRTWTLAAASGCQGNERCGRLRAAGRFQHRRCSMARIRHLAILTQDVDRLVKFYTNSFGLKIVEGVGTATYLTDGHINLAIIPIGPEREIEGNQLKEGINHFGFEVESVEALVPVCKQWGAATDVKKRPPTARRNPASGIPTATRSTFRSTDGRTE